MSVSNNNEIMTLGELSKCFQNGIGKGKKFYGSGTKVANIGDLYESHIFSPIKYSLLQCEKKEIEKYKLKRGDILFVRSSLKREGVAFCSSYESSEECLFSSFMIRISCDPTIVYSPFLTYQLRSPSGRAKLIANSNTSTITNISQDGLNKVSVWIPPLEIQQQIVERLDRAQALIDMRKEQISLMDQLIQSLFYDMFGDPVINPMGWECGELHSFAEIKSGVTKGRKLNGKETILVPYMRVANVQDGYLKLDDISEIDVLPTDVSKYRLEKGDILLTEGGDPDKLGRGAIWLGEIENCIHQNHIFRVRISSPMMIPKFALNVISSERGKRYFLKAAKQTTGIASINMKQLKKCPMFIPPIDLQNTFAERVQKIEAQKETMTTSLCGLQDNFNAMIQQAFKGELL